MIKALTEKKAAIVIATITAAILLLRIYILTPEHGSVLASISHLSQFFTILTNTLVMVTMFAIGFGFKMPRASTELVLSSILGVGLAYHTLLAHLWSPQGLVYIADQGVHTVVPLLTLLWWLVYKRKQSILKWKDSFLFIIWPLVYCTYAIIRAEFSGFYPYPFINVPEIGWNGLVVNVVGLSLAFYVIGLFIIAMTPLTFQRKN